MIKFLLLFLTLSLSFTIFGQIPDEEKDALISLFNSTDGANWNNNNNWDSSFPVSSWFGVTVEEVSGKDHVVEITLSSNNLVGTIPSQIENLTFLTHLDLYDNLISGNIPIELCNLNELSFLMLYFNQLTGNIPNEIGNLQNLTYFDLAFNSLTGEIPNTLENLTSLYHLNLSNNQLTGSIPIFLGSFTNLEIIKLGNNLLTGEIPSSIANLSNLTTLSVYSNLLTGTIPSELGENEQLEELILYNNLLTGAVPLELGNLTLLKFLSLANNMLSGDIPIEIENITTLEGIYLSDNSFNGDLDFSNIPNIISLRINNNDFISCNIQNGNNESLLYFYAENNPNLNCIVVDDADWCDIHWTNIDETTTFVESVEECNSIDIIESDIVNTIKVYPNPTSDIIYISNNPYKEGTINIFNVFGKKVFSSPYSDKLDIKHLVNGIYILTIDNCKNRTTYKIIKK